jgi:hypothetical protein
MKRKTRTHSPGIIEYGLYSYYFSSSSVRLATKSLAPIKKNRRYRFSFWNWVQKYYSNLADRFRTDRNDDVKAIFIEETLLRKIDGHKYWL